MEDVFFYPEIVPGRSRIEFAASIYVQSYGSEGRDSPYPQRESYSAYSKPVQDHSSVGIFLLILYVTI